MDFNWHNIGKLTGNDAENYYLKIALTISFLGDYVPIFLKISYKNKRL